MNGQQKAVLWIGLILVGLNLVSHWTTIRDVIFSGAGITSGIGTPSGGGGGFNIGGIIGRVLNPTGVPGLLSTSNPPQSSKKAKASVM